MHPIGCKLPSGSIKIFTSILRPQEADDEDKGTYLLIMTRSFKYIFHFLILLVLAACAQLPEYARPRVVEFDNQPAHQDRAFTYRTLTVDDFQAQSLPEDMASHSRKIAAHACCRLRTTDNTRYRITQGYFNQKIHYFGSIEYVRFEAVMVPDCSWLNPKVGEEKLDYVLQHEQIHFALMELAARKLNRESKDEVKNFIAIQATHEAVRDEIAAKIKDMVRNANERVLVEHTAFDEETSLYFDPESQQRWFDRIEKQLLLTAPQAEVK